MRPLSRRSPVSDTARAPTAPPQSDVDVTQLLEGQKGVILGVANKRSIAWSCAKSLSEHGMRLAFTYPNERMQKSVAALAAECEGSLVLPCDVTVPEQVEALAAEAAELGAIDIWVNNAGGLPDATPRYLTRTPEDRWDAQMDLNLKAVFRGCVIAAQNMTEGVIVNISSSSAARAGNLKNGPYGASKAAVNSLTQTFALELAPKIRVNAVAPGPVPTENFNESTNFPEGQDVAKLIGVPLRRLGTPEDIGNAVVYMASDASSWVTGQCLYVTGSP